MKTLKIAIAALLIASSFSIRPQNEIKRGRVSTCYHKVVNKCSNHKGKVGLAVGAIGTTVVTRIFRTEIDSYVKPFFKSVWKKTTNFFRRIFNREEKA